jgi:DNA-binding transcriptional LysR family regulator
MGDDFSSMELRHLRTFRAVAEELHFSRAAARLHVAQPALSRTIMDLESELGVRLLERNSRGVALTEAGSLFLERVKCILDDTQTAVSETQRRSRGETGILRIVRRDS